MSPTRPADDTGVPIAAVEQSTGIARATLRIWERRYGFPRPGRDERGERSYPADQVARLRLIAALVDRGHRPGRLVELGESELTALAGPALASPTPVARARSGGPDDAVLDLVRAHDAAAVVAHLEESLRAQGLDGFAARLVPELNVQVGACWARGELQVFEEHLYTEAVQVVLRNAIARLPAPPPDASPRVLLATLPEESHGLGLLMAQALLVAQGCRCTSLGVRVPLQQVVSAATAFESDIVGLSFSASMNPAHVLRGLEQLRAELPPRVAIWAGGSSPVLGRRRIPGVQPMRDVADVPTAVAQWRVQQEVREPA
jgi:methanogenic corrinoid protein MtbC1